MVRQIVIVVTAFFILVSTYPAVAQQAEKMPLIGYLSKRTANPSEPHLAAFLSGLRDLGYVDGRNIRMVYGNAKGRRERFPGLVADLIKRKVDVIVTNGGSPAKAAMKATSTIPIVVRVAGDFVAQGLVRSLRRPGGNVTGFSTLAHDLIGKQLQLFKEAVPTLSRVGILMSGSNPHKIGARQAREATAALGLGLVVATVAGAADIPGAFRKFVNEGAGGVLVLRSGFLLRLNKPILAHAAKAGLPTMFGHVVEAKAGGLLAYGADTKTMFRGAAGYVDKILKGATPAELPVQLSKKFLLTVNLKTAKALGIEIPRAILLRADEVIE